MTASKNKGFTLIELLVAFAVVGILSSIVTTTVFESRYKAQGAYLLETIRAIDLAFTLKGINDNRREWWQISDFPGESEWDEVIDIQDLIREAGIDEFLPVLPDGLPDSASDDFGAAPYDFSYAYQYYFPTDTKYSDPDPSECFKEDYTHTVAHFYSIQNGVNLLFQPDYDFQTRKFTETFKYLDEAIDGGDGQNCGRIKVITYPDWTAMYMFMLAPTGRFNR